MFKYTVLLTVASLINKAFTREIQSCEDESEAADKAIVCAIANDKYDVTTLVRAFYKLDTSLSVISMNRWLGMSSASLHIITIEDGCTYQRYISLSADGKNLLNNESLFADISMASIERAPIVR